MQPLLIKDINYTCAFPKDINEKAYLCYHWDCLFACIGFTIRIFKISLRIIKIDWSHTGEINK